MDKQLKSSLLILLAAFIWGTAFLAQKQGAYVGTFTFNGLRFVIGGAFLLPVIFVLDRIRAKKASKISSSHSEKVIVGEAVSGDAKGAVKTNSGDTSGVVEAAKGSAPGIDDIDSGWNKTVFIGGAIVGIVLFLATSSQQYGMPYTSLRNAGFITALYSVMVPVMSIAFGKKVTKLTWIGVVLGVVGLYFLSTAGESMRLSFGDTFMLLAALGFAVQIMIIDHYSPLVDPVKLSCAEFFTVGAISMVAMALFESPDPDAIMSALPELLYAGVLSSGVAYTLQVVGQRGANPTQASLIMCLESVFCMLTGMIVLGERAKPIELLGAALIFTAVVLSQIPARKK